MLDKSVRSKTFRLATDKQETKFNDNRTYLSY